MLCPEVWSFKSPSLNFLFKEGVCNEVNNVENFDMPILNKHYFNHSVAVVLPDTVIIPEELNSALSNNCDYYKLNNVSVSNFLDEEFINSFIKSGETTALCIGSTSNIDTDDCVAITPCGHLILSLVRETYQELGLEGKPSVISRRNPSRYIVHINLKEKTFMPGKKNYERVLKCLKEHVNMKMDFLIAWEPNDDKICPSSVASYFHKKGVEVSLCSPTCTPTKEYNIGVPPLTVDYQDLMEWLGCLLLGIKFQKENSVEDFMSSYELPQGCVHNSQVTLLQWSGFFTTKQLQDLLKTLRKYVESRSEMLWGCLHVQGFTDSPVSWNLQEHTFYTNGDNHYTIFIQPNKKFLTCKAYTSGKLLK
uniref:Uncharacterized protein n=2 Tax=Clastoptera arizonana TaxID=38151 RepID=A0A1B6DCK5_9HEMI